MDNPAARNQVFNVGADVPYAVNDLPAIVSGAMGVACTVVHLDSRNEVKVAFSDHSKAERVFGRKSQVSLHAGIRAMANWVKVHGPRESTVSSMTSKSQRTTRR